MHCKERDIFKCQKTGHIANVFCFTRVVSVHSLDRDVSRFVDVFGKSEEKAWLVNQYELDT